MLIHAISQDAARFYQRFRFIAALNDPFTLFATAADLQKTFGDAVEDKA